MPAALKNDKLVALMALACTRWGWSAEDFWRATPRDMALIFAGLRALAAPGATEFDAGDVAALRHLLAMHEQKPVEDPWPLTKP